MKIKTLQKKFYLFAVNHLLVGTRFFDLKRNMLNSIGFNIGSGTKIVGPIECNGTLIIGINCWIGRNLFVHGNGEVQIGNNCDIAPDVVFLTGGHAIGVESRRAGKGEIYHIEIGDGTWIGARVTIGRNVNVGMGSIIAACACVMQDIPSNVLVGGVPAKIIKEL